MVASPDALISLIASVMPSARSAENPRCSTAAQRVRGTLVWNGSDASQGNHQLEAMVGKLT